ncbi:tRNA dimethylallyltransferase [Lewinella aquimaris]|uniref:tRNA dimethylallyltransferase n=1 Tax=Neolewinella aquimaris TaxID=1835722 RepID=A0A840E792_9BACT|nr:tRNA (adenosine(37)-N6)-dimethylallyltransferase MiaA [Neolewinella aquimaris]MBB4077669.1 tRNA dimethylallyltransferase [Neolewinella aquimaris]
MKRVIVIGGPTASGKTSLAIEVARHFGTEIISADSRQFYREMRIGTARPSPEELAAVSHHFVADRSVTEPLSAGRFAEEGLHRLREIFTSHDLAVVVGGSGLFIRALCEGLDEFPEVTQEARRRVEEIEAREGLSGLQRALREADPAYFGEVDQQNGRRLQRALRVCFTEGLPYSSYLNKVTPRSFQSHYYALAPERAYLYQRIEKRVDHMLANGLEEEARSLLAYQQLPALQTVGYQEWWPYFREEYPRDRAIELIKRNSRRYAKRQVTYFRDFRAVEDFTEIAAQMEAVLG